MKKLVQSSLIIAGVLFGTSSNAQLKLSKISSYNTGVFDESATEISAYDIDSKRLFFTNGYTKTVDVVDLGLPENPYKIKSLDLSTYGGGANSVASHGGYIAVAVEADTKQDPGKIVIYKAADFSVAASYTVGALPDMVTFTHDGKQLVVACEGEPSDDYSVDPEGSIAIIDLTAGIDQGVVSILNFNAYDAQKAQLQASGIRIFGNNGTASVSQDLEPEYVAVAPDNKKAFVTLQENNAVAVVDLASKTITDLHTLGTIDHSTAGNEYDASDKDGIIDIKAQPTFGLPLPDAIASYQVNGKTYYVTANEGDTRDYDTYSEEVKVKDLTLDTNVFKNYAELQQEENLGRLLTTSANGDTDNDGKVDKIYSIGTRSFSIYDSAGTRIYDSGNQFEKKIEAVEPTFFNTSNDKNKFDDRSDAKGCEPEALTIAQIGTKTYAFIGLERMGGIMIFDITDPKNPIFDSYELNRDFTADITTADAGDLGPEGIIYIKPENTPIKDIADQGMLIVTNEVSGNVTIYAVGEYKKTSVQEVSTNSDFTVINPVSNNTLLCSESAQYSVIDSKGNNVLNFTGNTANVSGLAAGTYFINNNKGSVVSIVKL